MCVYIPSQHWQGLSAAWCYLYDVNKAETATVEIEVNTAYVCACVHVCVYAHVRTYLVPGSELLSLPCASQTP